MKIINEYGYITYEPQKFMDYGFIDYQNNVWPDHTVDSYNGYTRIINLIQPHQQGSICETERNTMLNRRHEFFVAMIDFFNKKAA